MLDSLVHPDSGLASLSIALGCDASRFDLDAPLPDEIPESNASKSGRERVIARARRDKLTVRQLAQIAGGYGGLAMVGTPQTIADEMEEWLDSGGCDGFNIMFPYVPGGLDDFVDRVVPELQRRGLFRTRIRGADAAREFGLEAARKPLFRGAGLSGAARRGRLPIRAERRAGRRRGPGGPAERDGVGRQADCIGQITAVARCGTSRHTRPKIAIADW